MLQDDSDGNPHGPDDQTEGIEQPRRTELSMDHLQSMITGSIQAALPSLENAIAEKVTQSLQAQGARQTRSTPETPLVQLPDPRTLAGMQTISYLVLCRRPP